MIGSFELFKVAVRVSELKKTFIQFIVNFLFWFAFLWSLVPLPKRLVYN